MNVYVVFVFYQSIDTEGCPRGVFTSERDALEACMMLEAEADEMDIEVEAVYVELPLDDISACSMMYWYELGEEVE